MRKVIKYVWKLQLKEWRVFTLSRIFWVEKVKTRQNFVEFLLYLVFLG